MVLQCCKLIGGVCQHNLALPVLVSMELITTKRGGLKLCWDGFMYTKKHCSATADKFTWRCVKRDPPVRCPGIVITTKDHQSPFVHIDHCHPADDVAVDVEKCRQGMKRKATSSLDKPNQIFTFATASVADAVKARLPAADTCKRVLRRARASNRPKEPQSLQELTISGEWAVTAGDSPVQFLLYDSGPDSDERVIIFATEEHLQQLAAADTWCMDGNFAMAPSVFMQLYVIQGRVDGIFLPLAYALLQRKTQSSYEVLLRVLEEHGCDPSHIIIDFERAVELATHVVFGSHVQIQYCFYHLTQATWRKIQTLGLTNLYKSDEQFRIFCGMLDALALLPPCEVQEGMQYLKDIQPDEADELVTYFDETYVTGKLRQRTRRPASDRVGSVAPITIRRVPPMFPPELWNMHEVTLANQPRTNNISEGWNNKFSSLVGHHHPSIWKLVECLKAECARVTTVLLQAEMGVRPRKRNKKVYMELQSRLRNLCEDRASDKKTIPQFLRGVSHNIRGGQPNI